MRQTRRKSFRKQRKQKRSKNRKYTKLAKSRKKQTKVYKRKAGNITQSIIKTSNVKKIKNYLNDIDKILRLPDEYKLQISAHLSKIARELDSDLNHISKGSIHMNTFMDKNYLEETSELISSTIKLSRGPDGVSFVDLDLKSFR